jgi:hypothetical protein
MNISQKIFIFLSLMIVLGSCYRKPDFPNTPFIEFQSIVKNVITDPISTGKVDSISITIKFQDGDGDLGLNSEDNSGVFAQNSPYYYNYKVTLLQEIAGVFTPVIFTGLSFDGRFPRLEEQGRRNPLEGTLTYSLKFVHALLPPTIPAGTRMKFRVRIYDRALNLSNEIETTPVAIKVP